MPDPKAVLNGTYKEIPDDAMVTYALCAALSSYASTANAKHLVPYLTSMKEKEYAAFTLKDALSRDPKLKQSDHIKKWFMHEGKTLLA